MFRQIGFGAWPSRPQHIHSGDAFDWSCVSGTFQRAAAGRPRAEFESVAVVLGMRSLKDSDDSVSDALLTLSGRPQRRRNSRLIRRLVFEHRAQQPVALETLHQFIGVNDRAGDLGEDFVVGLNLRVQIAREIRQVFQRAIQAAGHPGDVRVRIG